VELIKPEKREELIRDLEFRTGLDITRVEIGRIDYLRDSARIYIYYFEKDWTSINDSDQVMMDDGDDD
jgi:hypothetical protein